MRIVRYVTVPVIALATALIFGAAAHAQICGDANGSGTVDIADGLQTLRAAALLPSVCTPEACNVNGDGQIDVIDGVLVLRKAALLQITENCPGVERTIKDLVETALATIGYAASGATGTTAEAAAVESDPCADGGTVEFDTETGISRFIQCQEDGVLADGTVRAVGDTLAFDLTLTDVATSETLHITDQITFADGPQSSTVVNGTLAFSSSVAGEFELIFSSVAFTVDENDEVVVTGGTLVMNEGSSTTDLGVVDRLELRLNASGTDVVRVIARLDDGVERTFDFHIDTGELVEV